MTAHAKSVLKPVRATLASALETTRSRQKEMEQLSPFELKDFLINLARDRQKTSTAIMLNAGRGNPNWIATEPREAFFLLGRFAMDEARRVYDHGIMAGMPEKPGIAQRLRDFLQRNKNAPGADFLGGVYQYGVKKKGFDPDAWIHELVDSIIGDNYPVPDRMLVHTEQIVHDYLMKEMCDGRPPKGKFDLFAVEGGTAAMCYIFDSLQQNGLLKQGDKVALFLPTFTPYIEISHLERFQFKIVPINASSVRADGTHDWHYPPEEIAKLADPKIKLAVTVNPSNPPSVAFNPMEMRQIVDIIKKNPDLILVTDDVYGTFVPNFRSLMAEVPANTICVYSFSKNFGCTGWRLGVIAIHEQNRMDERIAKLPGKERKRLHQRYGALTLEPEKLKLIDRMVADSRDVALNHTAGLSLPQQVQMALFALSHLLDLKDSYKHLTMKVVQDRRDALWRGLGIPLPPEDKQRAWYYVELDFMVWAQSAYGDKFCEYMRKNYEPVDFLFRLAEKSGVVLMDGGGFGGPPWSIRVSLANLNEADYANIGQAMVEAAKEYVTAWQAGEKVHSGPRGVVPQLGVGAQPAPADRKQASNLPAPEPVAAPAGKKGKRMARAVQVWSAETASPSARKAAKKAGKKAAKKAVKEAAKEAPAAKKASKAAGKTAAKKAVKTAAKKAASKTGR
ncbi:bifunctional aspartate transaminase/aspartate 4-decarboxylase [Achromobacter aloeverae]|uniref:Aspartate 4-decarboxylase n=1 Tax=Achromobacter aloeverae TaxID=1750518 RepID=A0A4Q1HQC6_9BURK|nr:bifunctional aspartate transaminase/aspartate 4-decarboxylase [Achromobacter aloeverae]RXN93292.1 aspartate 4-decarboxylase [Achromobacter aloeverae]